MGDKLKQPKYGLARDVMGLHVITKDGHSMFWEDVVKDLKRKSFLEKKLLNSPATAGEADSYKGIKTEINAGKVLVPGK